MQGYLGEKIIDVSETGYKDYTPKDWALEWIFLYGQIDGSHHKSWVLDQVTRILNGTKVIVKRASWDNGHTELRITLDEPDETYFAWVKRYKEGEDGPETYDYYQGSAP